MHVHYNFLLIFIFFSSSVTYGDQWLKYIPMQKRKISGKALKANNDVTKYKYTRETGLSSPCCVFCPSTD